MRSVVLLVFVVQIICYGTLKANDMQSLAEKTLDFLLKYCDVETKKCGPLPENLQIEEWSFKRGGSKSTGTAGQHPEESGSALTKRSLPLAANRTSREDLQNDEPDVDDQDETTTQASNSTTTTPTNLVTEDNRMKHGSSPTPNLVPSRKTQTRDFPSSLTDTFPAGIQYPACVCHCAPCTSNEIVQDGSLTRKTGSDTDSLDTNHRTQSFDPATLDESAGSNMNSNVTSQWQALPASTPTRYVGSPEPMYGVRGPSQSMDNSDPLSSYLRNTVQKALTPLRNSGLIDPYLLRAPGLGWAPKDSSLEESPSSYPSQRTVNANWQYPNRQY